MFVEVYPNCWFEGPYSDSKRILCLFRRLQDVEGLAKYEVIPQNLDVEPVGYFPMAVTFTLWSKKAVPKSKLPPHVLKKFFEPLQAYDPVAEQMKQREEGTYQYTRFMGNGTQKENGHPLK